MRHRRKGRTLGRKPNHQRAMLRNLASSLFLSERDEDVSEDGFEYEDFDKPNTPKTKGRVITTVAKAKEARPLVERCITIAKKSLAAQEAAAEFATDAERGSSEWKSWRNSEQWQKWTQAIAPAVNARRRCIQLLGNKFAVEVLFDDIAERFADRPGGYTRVVKMATPRLGDAAPRAILELVGVRDRVSETSERPAFADENDDADIEAEDTEEELSQEPAEGEEAAESSHESAEDTAATQAEATAEAEVTGESETDEPTEEEKKENS